MEACIILHTYKHHFHIIYIFGFNASSFSETSVEFGVVMVYSCRESCWNSTDIQYRVEHIIVQADPDNDLLNNKGERSLPMKSTDSKNAVCQDDL